MMDIRDRLKKLAGLVRHDEEALSTCEDAIKEFDRLMPAGNVGAAASAASASTYSWYRGNQSVFSAPPPPSQTTQVKMGTGQDQILPLPYGRSLLDDMLQSLRDMDAEFEKLSLDIDNLR